MVDCIVDDIAAQLHHSYGFRIDFHRTEDASEGHDENQQNDHDDGRGHVDGVAQCDANVFMRFAVQFDDAGHAEWQQSWVPRHNPILQDFRELRQSCTRIISNAKYLDGIVNEVDEHGNQRQAQHKQLLIQNGNQASHEQRLEVDGTLRCFRCISELRTIARFGCLQIQIKLLLQHSGRIVVRIDMFECWWLNG